MSFRKSHSCIYEKTACKKHLQSCQFLQKYIIIKAETKQTLENIKAVLAQHDLQMQDVVKAIVVLDDIDDFSAFNAIYTTYFPQKPARTTFAAEALARGAKIEIEVIAVK